MIAAGWVVFRPVVSARLQRPSADSDSARARDVVRRHGADTLAYFALRDDKSYFFSSDGEALIGYTFVNGYVLVAADPIGAPDSVPRVVDEFLARDAVERRGRAVKPINLVWSCWVEVPLVGSCEPLAVFSP